MRFLRPFSTTKQLLTAGVFLCVMTAAGCNEYVTSERNPEVPIPKHATWAWRPVEAQPQPISRESRPVISRDEPSQGAKLVAQDEASNEILRGQIRVAITKALAEKGFKEVNDPQAAAFLVDFHIAVKDQRATVPVGYPGGYPGVVCGPYGWRAVLGLGSASVGLPRHRIPRRDFCVRLPASADEEGGISLHRTETREGRLHYLQTE